MNKNKIKTKNKKETVLDDNGNKINTSSNNDDHDNDDGDAVVDKIPSLDSMIATIKMLVKENEIQLSSLLLLSSSSCERQQQ